MTGVDQIDLEDRAFWVGPRAAIDDAFASLRAQPGLAYFSEVRPDGERFGGYWAVTRAHEVREVSARPRDFSSASGSNIPDFPPDMTEFFGSIIAMDNPRHARQRAIVQRGFTPRTLDQLRSDIGAVAATIISEVADQGECDFVTDIAARIPVRVIVDLMGIPRSHESFIFDATNVILGTTDPEYVPDQSSRGRRTAMMRAGEDLSALVRELAEDRIKNPRADLITALVVEGAEGDNLTPQELASFFILLVGAGNETTRNAITHGLLALTNHPDQRARWQEDLDAVTPTAIEEIVRWASPVLHMRRTVTADGVRLGDHEFAGGDKVVLWYYSANRDETVFEDPQRFDVTRSPNDHLAYGAPGPHYCLGAHLARREIAITFSELFRQLPDIHAVGEPEYLNTNFLHGIKHLRAEWRLR